MPQVNYAHPKLDIGKNKPKSQLRLLERENGIGMYKTKSMTSGISVVNNARVEMDTHSRKVHDEDSREEKVKKVIREIEEVMRYQGGNAKNQLLRLLKNKLSAVSSLKTSRSEEDEKVIIDVIKEIRENANLHKARDTTGKSEERNSLKKELIINVPASTIDRMDPCHNILETYETAIPLKRCEGYSDVSMTPVRVNQVSSKKWAVQSSAVEYYHPMCNQSNTDLTENSLNTIRLPISYEPGQKLVKTYSVADCTSQSRVQQLTMFWNQILGPDLSNSKEDESMEEVGDKTTSKKQEKPVEESNQVKTPPKKKDDKKGKAKIKKKMPYFPVPKEGSSSEQKRVFKPDSSSNRSDKRNFKSKAKMNLLSKVPEKNYSVTIVPSREPSTYIAKIPLDSDSPDSDDSETIGTVYHAELIKDPKSQHTCVVKMNQELVLDEELSLNDIIATLEKLQTILQNSPCKTPDDLPVPYTIKKKIVDLVVSTQEMTNKPSSDFFCLKFPWEKRIFISPQTGNLIGYMKKDFSIQTEHYGSGPFTSYEHHVSINSGVAVFITPIVPSESGKNELKQRKLRSPATINSLQCYYSTVSTPYMIQFPKVSSAGGDFNKPRNKKKKSKMITVNIINLAPNSNRSFSDVETNTEEIFPSYIEQFHKTIPNNSANDNKVCLKRNRVCSTIKGPISGVNQLSAVYTFLGKHEEKTKENQLIFIKKILAQAPVENYWKKL